MVNVNEPCPLDDGDTTWMLLSTLLVLTMMPALAIFEAGLLRAKNTMSIITQIFVGVVLLSTLWVAVGYSLVFYGNLDKAFFTNGRFASGDGHWWPCAALRVV